VRTFAALVTALVLGASIASPAHAIVINAYAIDRPDGKGDQVVFYYDARPDYTTFLNLHNDGAFDLDVRVLFYGPTFSGVPFTRTYALDAGGTHIIDVGALKGEEPALPAQFGVAIATAVDGDGHPIVTRALSGNFTVANLDVHSAWGAPGAARSAVTAGVDLVQAVSSGPPDVGVVIDGAAVLLPPIQPTNAHLAVYYNPETLEPPSLGGNQLIFLTFEDVPGDTYGAQSAMTSWTVTATRSNGSTIGPITPFLASGVSVSDLASIAGSGVNGSSGSMSFDAAPTGAFVSRLIFFTETLGTFATGYLLPPTLTELPLL
jgi:hypothetical protein